MTTDASILYRGEVDWWDWDKGISVTFHLTRADLHEWREVFEYETNISVRRNKIQAIKSFRLAYHVGLRDAKEIVEFLIDNPSPTAHRRELSEDISKLQEKLNTLTERVSRYDRWIDATRGDLIRPVPFDDDAEAFLAASYELQSLLNNTRDALYNARYEVWDEIGMAQTTLDELVRVEDMAKGGS